MARDDAEREYSFTDTIPTHDQTTEWITVTATTSEGWVEDITLSYFGVVNAWDVTAVQDEPIVLRYHVIIDPQSLVIGWVRGKPLHPGAPTPSIGPAQDGHVRHLGVEIDHPSDAAADTVAALLAERILSTNQLS